MQSKIVQLHAHETCLAITATEDSINTVNEFISRLKYLDESRAELSIEFSEDSINVRESDWALFNDLITDSSFKRYRTVINNGNRITLTFPDKLHTAKKNKLNTAYMFYLGDGCFSLLSHEDIKIDKVRSSGSGRRIISNRVLSLLGETLESDPSDLKEVKIHLDHAMFIQEYLMALSHETMMDNDKLELTGLVVKTQILTKRLESTKRRLKVQPNFEATEKSLLIAKLRNYFDANGQSNIFRKLQIEARKEATNLTAGNQGAKVDAMFERVESHSLHSGFSSLFTSSAPPALPMAKCFACGGSPKLEKSFHPVSKKKRFEVFCSSCNVRAATSLSHSASGAIVNWNIFSPDQHIEWNDIEVFNNHIIEGKGHSLFLKDLHEYIELYDNYVNQKLKSVDTDKASRYRAIKSKLEYLKDSRTMGKRLLKIMVNSQI
ncbi:MAG: hypothetical protein ACI9T7_000123 [Oleiphilaceae bacterium]|jgi:hypothetical protein